MIELRLSNPQWKLLTISFSLATISSFQHEARWSGYKIAKLTVKEGFTEYN